MTTTTSSLVSAQRIGRVISAMNDSVVATLPFAYVGQGVRIRPRASAAVPGMVTRIDAGRVRLSAFAPLDGVSIGDVVESDATANVLPLGTELLGRAIDAAGRPIDGGSMVRGRRCDVYGAAIGAASRRPVDEPFWTGIRTIDGMLTIGRGARVGIFGAPGAGKSTLMEMLVHGARADAVVVGLIGERGREAAKWLEKIAPHATLVIVPSDRSAAERVRGAYVAVAQAAELRRRGMSVLCILDSLARFCSAARELAVANGETVGRGGYPPSVFNEMARLIERAGNVDGGSVTLLATVLSDGGDEREPLSDAARAALDGHIVLSSELGRAGRYPAIDVLASASRTMNDVISPQHRADANALRRTMALLEETKDARDLGLARSTPQLDRAIASIPRLEAFLRQPEPAAVPSDTLAALGELAGENDALAASA